MAVSLLQQPQPSEDSALRPPGCQTCEMLVPHMGIMEIMCWKVAAMSLGLLQLMISGAIAGPIFPKTSCNRDAAVISAPSRNFPQQLRERAQSIQHIVDVKVYLSAAGHPERAVVLRSYGTGSLDASDVRALNSEALREALGARYASRRVHCKGVPSIYVFKAVFNGAA